VAPGSLIPLGFAIARIALQVWLKDQELAQDTGLEMADMLERKVGNPFLRNKAKRDFERIAEDMAERLAPYFRIEYGELPANEARAAAFTLERALRRLRIDDRILFASDLNPAILEQYVRQQAPNASADALLSPGATRLYDFALGEACNYIVEIAVSLPAFSARATAELLSRETELAGLVRTALEKLPQKGGTEDDPATRFDREYAREVARRLDRLELFGLDTETVPRRFALSVAYITLTASVTLDQKSASRPQQIETGETDGVDTVRVDEALGARRRTIVRGEAGSGKTTLLQWLAVSAARQVFSGPLEDWNACVPFFVRLRRFARTQLPAPEAWPAEIAPALVGDMPNGWVHEQLRAGRALVLIDGVDELPELRREDARDWLAGLVTAFPAARYLVTSRPPAVAEDWLDSLTFSSTELEPMGTRDIQSFIDHWHQAAEDNGASETDQAVSGDSADVRRLIREQPALHALATSPLLCAMLCALHRNRRAQLPRDRVQLYRIALDMLLERRDVERRISEDVDLSLREKELLLQALAYSLVANQVSDEDREAVIEIFRNQLKSMPHVSSNAESVYRYLLTRSGLVREPSAERVDFIHRTFQEYLAAKEALDRNLVKMLVREAGSDHWRETIVLAAGLAQATQRGDLIQGILDRGDAEIAERHKLHLLAAACLETSPQLSAELTASLRDRIRSLVPPRNMTEARALASAGNLAAPFLARDPSWYATQTAAAVRALALIGGETAMSLLRDFGRDARVTVARELLRSWPLFDVEAFAREVLAESPLSYGRVHIDDPALIGGVQYLQKLRALSCDFFKEGAEWEQLEGLEIPILVTLHAWPDPTLAGLGSVRSLTLLHIPSPARLTDIRDLTGLAQLTEIRITGAGNLKDPSPLATCLNLETLVLDHTGITELSWISRLERLQRFEAAYCKSLEVVAGIEACGALTSLDLRGCDRLRNIDGVGQLRALVELWVSELPALQSLRELSSLDKLQYLNCGGATGLADLEGVVSPALQTLALDHCAGLLTLDGMGDLGELVQFSAYGATGLQEISALGRAPGVKGLDLTAVPAEDLSPLRELTQLVDLRLQRCVGVTDVAFARYMPLLDRLDVGSCPLTDLNDLASHPALRELYIDGVTDIADVAVLHTIPKLAAVWIDDNVNRETRTGLQELRETREGFRLLRRSRSRAPLLRRRAFRYPRRREP
jgi:hypothetical protein